MKVDIKTNKIENVDIQSAELGSLDETKVKCIRREVPTAPNSQMCAVAV